MNRPCTLGVLILLLTAAAFAQQPLAFDPTIRTFPVVVTDASGKPVTGLKQSDFTVTSEGVQLQILSVQELPPAVLPPEDGSPPRPAVYILFDELGHWAPAASTLDSFEGEYLISSMDRGRKELVRYLAQATQIGQQCEVIITGPKGLGVIHRLTTPLPVLAAALQRVDRETHVLGGKFSPATSAPDSKAVDEETSRLLAFLRNFVWVGDDPQLLRQQAPSFGNWRSFQAASLQELVEALRSVAGRKPVIWIPDQYMPELDERRIELLNQAAVSLYPGPSSDTRTNDTAGMTVPGTVQYPDVMTADATAAAVSAVLKDCGPYYLLRLSVPTGRPRRDATKIKIHVTVNRPGVLVRTRTTFSTRSD